MYIYRYIYIWTCPSDREQLVAPEHHRCPSIPAGPGVYDFSAAKHERYAAEHELSTTAEHE